MMKLLDKIKCVIAIKCLQGICCKSKCEDCRFNTNTIKGCIIYELSGIIIKEIDKHDNK